MYKWSTLSTSSLHIKWVIAIVVIAALKQTKLIFVHEAAYTKGGKEIFIGDLEMQSQSFNFKVGWMTKFI